MSSIFDLRFFFLKQNYCFGSDGICILADSWTFEKKPYSCSSTKVINLYNVPQYYVKYASIPWLCKVTRIEVYFFRIQTPQCIKISRNKWITWCLIADIICYKLNYIQRGSPDQKVKIESRVLRLQLMTSIYITEHSVSRFSFFKLNQSMKD